MLLYSCSWLTRYLTKGIGRYGSARLSHEASVSLDAAMRRALVLHVASLAHV